MYTRKLKSQISVTLCLIILLISTINSYTIAFAAVSTNGTYKDISWTLDETGTLTIRGNGEITQDINIAPHINEIKNIIISSGVTSMAANMFSSFTQLETVVLPEGFTSVSSCAFASCQKLREVTLPDSVTSIESGAFIGCSALKSIKLPANLTSIADEAFRSSGIEEISIPSGITTIADYTFCNCENLRSVILPDTLEKIMLSAFDCCTALEEIELPANIVFIDMLAFRGCTSLKTLTFPDGIESIHLYTVNNCPSLTEVTIPSSVKNIGEHNFDTCPSLKVINYLGTKEQWNNITIEANGNSCLSTSATINFINFKNSAKAKFADGCIIKNETVTAAQLISHTENTAVIKDSAGKNIKNESAVGTGMTLLMSSGKEFEIICPGDIDGNGIITASDARLTLRMSVGLESYNVDSVFFKAADIDGDGVKASDARLILRASVALENTLKWI